MGGTTAEMVATAEMVPTTSIFATTALVETTTTTLRRWCIANGVNNSIAKSCVSWNITCHMGMEFYCLVLAIRHVWVLLRKCSVTEHFHYPKSALLLLESNNTVSLCSLDKDISC